MTTANADPVITPVKSDISFGNPNDPPQGTINSPPLRFRPRVV
jgi:oxalate decarboxylase